MKYKYLTVYIFEGKQIFSLEQSTFELEADKIVNDYKVRIKINDEQFNEISKLLDYDAGD